MSFNHDGAGVIGGSTSGVSRFGRLLSPPSVQPVYLDLFALIVAALGGTAMLVVAAATLVSWKEGAMANAAVAIVVGIGFLACIPFVLRSVRRKKSFNATTYHQLMEQWDRTWVCYQCGVSWDPEPPELEESQVSLPKRIDARVRPTENPAGLPRATSISFTDEPR